MKMHRSFKFLTAALMLTAAPWIVTSTVAAPLSSSLGLQNADPSSIETVQDGYEWNGAYRGRRRIAGIAVPIAGIAAPIAVVTDMTGTTPIRMHRATDMAGTTPMRMRLELPHLTIMAANPSVSNRRSCLTEYAGREELCGFYGALYRRTYQ